LGTIDHETPEDSLLTSQETIKVTGVLRKKIHMRTILKKNTAIYISLESLINVDFRKKYKLPVCLIPQKKIAINCENDHVSFN